MDESQIRKDLVGNNRDIFVVPSPLFALTEWGKQEGTSFTTTRVPAEIATEHRQERRALPLHTEVSG
jgi:hypothetical protein